MFELEKKIEVQNKIKKKKNFFKILFFFYKNFVLTYKYSSLKVSPYNDKLNCTKVKLNKNYLEF